MVAVYITETYYRRGLVRVEWFNDLKAAQQFVATQGLDSEIGSRKAWIK